MSAAKPQKLTHGWQDHAQERGPGARAPGASGGHVRTSPSTQTRAHAHPCHGQTCTYARKSPAQASRQTGTREHAGKHTRAGRLTLERAGAQSPAMPANRPRMAWRAKAISSRPSTRSTFVSAPAPRRGSGPFPPPAQHPWVSLRGLSATKPRKLTHGRQDRPRERSPGARAPWRTGTRIPGRTGTQAGAHGRARAPRPWGTRRQAPPWRRAGARAGKRLGGGTRAGRRTHARGRAPARSRAPSARRCPRAGRAWPGARRRSPRARGRVRCWARHPSPSRPAPPRPAPPRGRARG